MRRSVRYMPRPAPDRPFDLFRSAEDAWFWFVRCQQLRLDNARLDSRPGEFVRPCEPDDIYRAVMALHRQHRLHSRHLQVLSQFGLKERSPDRRREDERSAARLWSDALSVLSIALVEKGIVRKIR